MKGDKFVIHEGHVRAASQVVDAILPAIKKSKKVYTVSIAGESGSGKSETSLCLVKSLAQNNLSSYIFQQDDYFIYPPKTNTLMRQKDISNVGMHEVKLDLLDKHLQEIKQGKKRIKKPLVIFDHDLITEETADLTGIQVVIVDGTYTTTLKNVDTHVFINRNHEDTKESRKKRSREKQDKFLSEILLIEHNIIKKHKAKADLVIAKDYNLEMPGNE